jgi:hypothetical protein
MPLTVTGPMSERRIIATLEKVQIALVDRDVILIDLRVVVGFRGIKAGKRPIKKGISLKLAKLIAIIQTFKKARAEAERHEFLTWERVS